MSEAAAVIYLPGPIAPPQEGKKPRRGSETRVRSDVMYVRLTDSERREIEAQAKAAGLEPGAYARQTALAAPEQRGTAAPVTLRPTRLPFRVSQPERAQIEGAADRAGLTPGSYIRARALKNPVTLTTRRPPVERAELARLLGLLGNATSNLNQIARQLNMDGEVLLSDVQEAVALNQAAAAEIIRSLGREPKPRNAR